MLCLKALLAALLGGGNEFALMLDFGFLHFEVVVLLCDGAVDVELLQLSNLGVVAVVLRLDTLGIETLLLLLLGLSPLGGDGQPLGLRKVGMEKLTLVILDRYLVHALHVGEIVSFAGGVTDTGRSLLLFLPLLFLGELVGAAGISATTSASVAASTASGVGNRDIRIFRLHKGLRRNLVFLAQKFVGLIELTLLCQVSLISGLGSIVGLTRGCDPAGVGSDIYSLTCGGVCGVCVGLIALHLTGPVPVGDGGIVSLLVPVALRFQSRSLLFQSEQLLLVLLDFGGCGTGAGNLDDGVAELVVGDPRIAYHYFLRREVLEIVRI